MKIAGFEPLSLSDFPGHCAAVVFTRGCNWRCPFCHNGSLWASAGEGPGEQRVLTLLRQRARLLDVVVSGGEPTLQPDLPDFLVELKALGLKVKLDTNGSFPNVLKQVLSKGLVDFVAMDIKAPWDRYAELAGVDADVTALQASIKHIIDWGGTHQFRTTHVPNLLTNADISHIHDALPANVTHHVQPFIPELAADARLRQAG